VQRLHDYLCLHTPEIVADCGGSHKLTDRILCIVSLVLAAAAAAAGQLGKFTDMQMMMCLAPDSMVNPDHPA
jgi:hypothetical protein